MKNKLELYFKAAQSAKIGIWEVNLDDQSLYWDAVTKSIHEVSENYAPNIEDAILFYTEGKNREEIIAFSKKAMIDGLSFNKKFQIITAKNNTKYIECICKVELRDGKPNRLIGTLQDITTEQNLINELQINVERFSSIFSSANDAIFIIDSSNGIISECNLRASELTGYDYLELVGLHNSELFPLNNRKEVEIFLADHLALDNYIVDHTYIKTKQGDTLPVEVASGKKFTVEQQTFLVCFFRDISERRNVEEKMALLSLVASETTDAIVIANAEGNAVWANDAYLALTGFSMKEVLGKKPGCFSKGPETDLQMTNKMRTAIDNKKSIKVTILNYTKQKEKYWFELNVTPVFDDHNVCINFVGVGRDVTNRKEKEIELKSLLEVTSQQNEKLLNFSHIVSHNIRSHASNLSMLVTVMESTDDIAEKLNYFDLFKEGTDKLSETIEYLNEIITRQKNTTIEKSSIRLKDEIEKTKNALSLLIKESQIEIIDNIPDHLEVNAIPAYLDSILLNLITNAIKYRSLERKPILEITYEIDEFYKIIVFKDNGLGLNLQKNKHKIFGMYKTFHGNEDAKGIGLFITKNQLEAMAGKIEVESEPGKGSVFKIYLNEK
ncbi:MAG: PAS domain S-box protein [Burkholderiales bacterium]|nr:PAS domain S-box protein [Flavobacterium sp.]